MLRAGEANFLITGDVYRRDTIDATHYPVFHQMEAVRVLSEEDWTAAGLTAEELAEKELKQSLEGLARHLFGDVDCRWGKGASWLVIRCHARRESRMLKYGKGLHALGIGVGFMCRRG